MSTVIGVDNPQKHTKVITQTKSKIKRNTGQTYILFGPKITTFPISSSMSLFCDTYANMTTTDRYGVILVPLLMTTDCPFPLRKPLLTSSDLSRGLRNYY